jgi:hypothetical protein
LGHVYIYLRFLDLLEHLPVGTCKLQMAPS